MFGYNIYEVNTDAVNKIKVCSELWMRDAETFGLCKGGKYEAWKYGKTDPIFKVKGKYDKKDVM